MLGVSALVASAALAGCAPQAPQPPHAVVTFQVAGDETFKVELDSADLIQHARDLLAGQDVASIPNGKVVRDGDGGVNAPWSWHIDPATFEFADATTEVCDGIPSYVEDRTVTSDYYCPWSAKVIAVDDK